MRSLTVMSFVFALLLAILHANEANASKKDAMPDAIAALTKLVKKAKTETETSEQINKGKKMAASAGKNVPPRPPPDALRNQKKPKSPPRGKKNERKPSPPRGQKKNERKPRPSRGKLSAQQIKEIDRQKAASRSAAQKRKVEQKKRDMERRNQKEEVLVRKQLQSIIKQSKDNGCVNGRKSDKCESLRKKFDMNNDGDMTRAEIEEKLKNTLIEMRNYRKNPNRPPPRRFANARPNRPNSDRPRSPSRTELEKRPRSPSRKEIEKRPRSPARKETKGRPTPPMSNYKSELQKFIEERNANKNGNRNANRNANRYANRNANRNADRKVNVRKADRNDGDRNDEERRRPPTEAERQKFFEEMAKEMQNRGKFDRNADDGDRIPFDPRREELQLEFEDREEYERWNQDNEEREDLRNNRNKAKNEPETELKPAPKRRPNKNDNDGDRAGPKNRVPKKQGGRQG